MRSRKKRRGGHAGERPTAGGRGGRDRASTFAEVLVWALLLLPPFVVLPTYADAFDLPKLMLSELLGLASLLALAWRLTREGVPGPARLARLPALRAAGPALAVATLGLAFTQHPAHVREGLADLWIGAACLVGWSVGLAPARLRRLLAGLVLPASVLALLAALQFHGVYRPFAFAGGVETERLGVTSLAGNTGVLADYLALAALIAQWLLYRAWAGRWGRRRGLALAAAAVALGLCLYGLAATQTVTGLVALGAGSAALWLAVLPRRRALAGLAGAAVLAAVALALVTPLRERVTTTAELIAAGRPDRALRGRTDGWRAGLWMASQRPLTGIGHGAYATEFADAKLALRESGVELYRGQRQPMFADAHNELIQAAAEWGLPGVAALAWGLWVLLAAVRRRFAAARPPEEPPEDGALAAGGTLVLALLALGHFPFRVALVGFPALLLLAWILAPPPAEEGAAE